MKPLYAARIEDLGPGDFVKVECTACRHTELLSADMLRLSGCPLPPYTGILDLEPKLRCRECDARGKATVSIKWAEVDP
jgi:predicted nucleic-acid-binding Zn-ribbon protein